MGHPLYVELQEDSPLGLGKNYTIPVVDWEV